MKFIVVKGDPNSDEPLEAFGPFDDKASAENYADQLSEEDQDSPYDVIPLTKGEIK